MKRSNLAKVVGVSAIATLVSILPLTLSISVKAEAPPDENYNPPRQLNDANMPPNTPLPQAKIPSQGVSNVQSNRNFDWGWVGLLGLVGLAGLTRRTGITHFNGGINKAGSRE